jgi:hypothetical protein
MRRPRSWPATTRTPPRYGGHTVGVPPTDRPAASHAADGALPPEPTIVCVDCGGTAHLLTAPREAGEWYAGDIVSYRCTDCRDRWDLELPPATD